MAWKAVWWGDVLDHAFELHDQHGRGDGGRSGRPGRGGARRREGEDRGRSPLGDQADRQAGMTTASLILVRHGRPVINPDIPPPQWGLCPEGRDAVAALAEKLVAFAPKAAISSPEPKALQTAEIIGQRLSLAVED